MIKAIRIFLLILIIIGIALLCTQPLWVPRLTDKILSWENPSGALQEAVSPVNTDYKNGTYSIEGVPVTLVNGIAETPAAPGSASEIVTKYFGDESVGDLNGDDHPDVAFILTQDSGGSGTFYYVVVALSTTNGYIGTNAVLLGDRIAPQTTQIKNEALVVNYADRAPADAMTVTPYIGMTQYLRVQGTDLISN